MFDPTPSAARSCGETQGDIPFVKRVIGLPGDQVVVTRDGQTLVNGRPFVIDKAIPPDRLLVLGDNRSGSCDSHKWMPDPFVPEENVIGQAEITYWPLGNVRFLD